MRIADQIQREVAQIIAQDLRDPRVATVTVSGAEVSRDLRNAKVFIAAQSGANMREVLTTLHKAVGFLRTRLAKRLHMRYMPRLQFVHDTTLDKADRITQLLNAAPQPAFRTMAEAEAEAEADQVQREGHDGP